MNIEELRAALARHLSDAEALVTRAEADNRDLNADEQGVYDEHLTQVQSLTGRIERAERVERVRLSAQDPRNREAAFAPAAAAGSLVASAQDNKTRAWDGLDQIGTVDGWDPEQLRRLSLIAVAEMDGLEAPARAKLDEMIRHDRSNDAPRFVMALGNPAYRTAFDRWLRSPETAHLAMTAEEGAAWRDVEVTRAAMNESGASALLPLALDPAIALTNVGSAGNVRQYAKVRTTASNSLRSVTSAGATAEFKTEGSEAADASPSVAGVDVPVYLADASITVSYELFQDTDIASQLGGLVADARANQENGVFIAGSGSGAPYGALTRISATTGSRVSATTASTFTTASYPDVFKVRDAVPARHRQAGSTAWVSNIAIQSIIQQMGVANAGPNGFWQSMSDGPGGSLLGFPSLEATSMTGTIGSGAYILALVNWSQYLIVDRLGTAVTRTNVAGSSHRSTGQWEFFFYWRYGADLLNFDAGRVLKL